MNCSRRVRLANFAVVAVGVALFGIILCSPTFAADNETSLAANKAKNLARFNCGTRIDWISPTGRARVNLLERQRSRAAEQLILEDQTLNCTLPQGENTFVLTLPRISLLDRFSFINEQAAVAGKVEISVSDYRLAPNDSRWQTTDGSFDFSGRRFVNLSLTGIEAKYIRISFSIVKEGSIAGFSLFGATTLESFAERKRGSTDGSIGLAYISRDIPLSDMVNFNYANLYANARVVYVSSGTKTVARRMIDDDPLTAFSFAPTDVHPTAIVELADNQRLRRVSAIYEMQPGRLDIYVLNELPEEIARLDAAKPVVSLTDKGGTGKGAADFDPHGARYIALRWTPKPGDGQSTSFTIAEIGAFGEGSVSLANLNEVPERLAQSPPVTVVPVEPPVVVPVSP